jgi:hypothetical protein
MLANALLQHILTPLVLCCLLLRTQEVTLYVVMEASYQTTTLFQVAIWISTLMLPKLYHLFPKWAFETCKEKNSQTLKSQRAWNSSHWLTQLRSMCWIPTDKVNGFFNLVYHDNGFHFTYFRGQYARVYLDKYYICEHYLVVSKWTIYINRWNYKHF